MKQEICDICGEPIDIMYYDDDGRPIMNNIMVSTQSYPIGTPIPSEIPLKVVHQECIEHERLWNRIRKLERKR